MYLLLWYIFLHTHTILRQVPIYCPFLREEWTVLGQFHIQDLDVTRPLCKSWSVTQTITLWKPLCNYLLVLYGKGVLLSWVHIFYTHSLLHNLNFFMLSALTVFSAIIFIHLPPLYYKSIFLHHCKQVSWLISCYTFRFFHPTALKELFTVLVISLL